MKKIILSASLLVTMTSCLIGNVHKAKAETLDDITCINNVYQMYEVQSSNNNLYLGNSIYNYGKGHIRQSNSIRIYKPQTEYLTIYFKFNKNLETYNYSDGEFRLSLIDDNNRALIQYAQQINSVDYLKQVVENDYQSVFSYNQNEMFFQFDVSSFGDFITIGGDDLEDEYSHFSLMLGEEELFIERFMLYDGTINDFVYSSPEYGIGKMSDKVYLDGDSFLCNVDFDNRYTLEQIKDFVTAYDFNDKQIIIPDIENDSYSDAVENNKLGTFSVKLSASDTSNNTTSITIYLTIKDITSPTLTGQKEIEIHYTDLIGDTIDITKYVEGLDNYDGTILLDDSYKEYKPKKFTTDLVNISLKDSSGNIGEGTVSIKITDNVNPIITGPEILEVYQYELSSLDDIKNKYNIIDEGSGIDHTSVIFDGNYDFTKPGSYSFTIGAQDLCGNTISKKMMLKVKDGIGPVFFINTSKISVDTRSLLSAKQVINKLMDNGTIAKHKYSKYEYITTSYQENYNNPGKYDTQIICYSEDGNRDYYLVSIEVKKASNNFFINFYYSMLDFFNSIKNFFIKTYQYIAHFFNK